MPTQNRSSNGGGVLLYAKSSLVIVKLNEHVESIFTKFKSQNLSVVVRKSYRPPNSSIEIFTEKLYSILNILPCEHHSSNVYLMGDFNLDFSKTGVKSKHLEYYTLMSSYGYSPSILRSTRATLTSFTIIVQIWYSSSDQG